MTVEITKRARQLRERQTRAESLLWNVLGAKRLSGLKFRRQHDYQYENDASRQKYLEGRGWPVLRYSNEDVLDDVEAVAIAIAKKLWNEGEAAALSRA